MSCNQPTQDCHCFRRLNWRFSCRMTAPLQKVSLRAADIDLLIATLAHHRATMEPEVPRTLPDLKEVRTALDPNSILHAPASTNNKLLFIRHPGLGWLMFQLPPPEAAKLGHGLLSGRSQQIGDQRSLNRPLHRPRHHQGTSHDHRIARRAVLTRWGSPWPGSRVRNLAHRAVAGGLGTPDCRT